MSQLRMIPYDCDPNTGICGGGFGGGGPTGYSWAVSSVPMFAGYSYPQTPVLAGPETPILIDPSQVPGSAPGVPVVTVGGQVVTPATTTVPTQPQAEIAGIPVLWIGAGLLALFLLSK